MSGPARPGHPRRWGVLLFLMGLCFISHFNRASITSAGDERIMAQFGISPQRMGFLYTAFLLAYTIFMIPGGCFTDRKGPRTALAAMGIGSALFCAVTGLVGMGMLPAAQVWVGLLVVRSVMGILSAPLHPAAARGVALAFLPEQQNLANGLITGASIMAYALVHPVFGALIDRMDWPVAFVLSGLLTASLAISWFFFARQLDQKAEAEIPAFSRALLKDRSLLLLTASYAAIGYFQYLFFYWLHYYFDSILKMEKSESRFYAGLPNLAMALSMPLGGWLAGRALRKFGAVSIVPKIGMILSAAFLLLGVFSHEKLWIVCWFTLSLGTLGLCESAFWTTAVGLGGTAGGTAAAIMNTGGNGIGLLAPVLTPWISSRLGWGWGISLGALIAIAGAFCWMGVREKAP